MYIIGVDYAIGGDTPMYTVLKKSEDALKLVDMGLIENFNYNKYVATEHQIVGEEYELELFKRHLESKRQKP